MACADKDYAVIRGRLQVRCRVRTKAGVCVYRVKSFTRPKQTAGARPSI